MQNLAHYLDEPGMETTNTYIEDRGATGSPLPPQKKPKQNKKPKNNKDQPATKNSTQSPHLTS